MEFNRRQNHMNLDEALDTAHTTPKEIIGQKQVMQKENISNPGYISRTLWEDLYISDSEDEDEGNENLASVDLPFYEDMVGTSDEVIFQLCRKPDDQLIVDIFKFAAESKHLGETACLDLSDLHTYDEAAVHLSNGYLDCEKEPTQSLDNTKREEEININKRPREHDEDVIQTNKRSKMMPDLYHEIDQFIRRPTRPRRPPTSRPVRRIPDPKK